MMARLSSISYEWPSLITKAQDRAQARSFLFEYSGCEGHNGNAILVKKR